MRALMKGLTDAEFEPALVVVNTVIANLSTAIKATHKAFTPKHTADYIGAFCWTTNRPRNMTGMLRALCRAVATSSPLTRNLAYASPAVCWLIGSFFHG